MWCLVVARSIVVNSTPLFYVFEKWLRSDLNCSIVFVRSSADNKIRIDGKMDCEKMILCLNVTVRIVWISWFVYFLLNLFEAIRLWMSFSKITNYEYSVLQRTFGHNLRTARRTILTQFIWGTVRPYGTSQTFGHPNVVFCFEYKLYST